MLHTTTLKNFKVVKRKDLIEENIIILNYNLHTNY